MLGIEVTFLTGRYVATAYNSRREGEWPPHPARLFSAVVAAHFDADTAMPRAGDERAVLEWLEHQGPPSIRASEATPREVVTVFVPVNDTALTDVDDEARELDEARAALIGAERTGEAKSVKKHAALVKTADLALKKATARATAVPAKPLAATYGRRQLPEFRGRQPRTFPSMTPADPTVTYIWPDATASGEQLAVLDGLLGRVIRLGHASSLVAMRVLEEPVLATWRPDAEGALRLRVIERGQVAALERAYERHREVEPRVMPAVPHGYSRVTPVTTETVPQSIFSDDWLVLRRVGGPSIPMTAAAGLARSVRKALMSFADEPIPEMLSGHTPDGQPSKMAHLSVVPLPFVGHQHASGIILGISLVLPRDAGLAARRSIYEAVARWEREYRLEDEDIPAVQLTLGAAGVLSLERVEWGFVQASLQARVWCGPSAVWYSVTPVALDRNPGDLRSRDPRVLARATDDAIEGLCEACERVGLPRPRDVEILPAAPWAGAAKTRAYAGYPNDRARTQRVLTHVRIEFDRPVQGPVLLGAGRYVGLGLFRPEAQR